MEFRRIAAYLYRRNQKYELSINLSKQDHVYRDAIETAQES
jgi:clathrin heavy chain